MTGIDELSKEERAEFDAYYHDLPWYAANAPLLVLDKVTTQMVPLRFNVGQKYVQARQWMQAKTGAPVRSLVPKYRQGGQTTRGLGNFVHIANTREDRMMMLMLHDLKLAEPMYDRIIKMHTNIGNEEHVPEGGIILPRAKITTDKKGSAIGFETGSLIQIETAGKAQGIGRGNTIHHVHATEIPSWLNPTTTMKGLKESVPELGMFESSITLESTSEGVGDWWYWSCMRAQEGKGEFDLIFLPWFLELAYGAFDPKPVDLRHAFTTGGDRDLASCLKEPLSTEEEEIAKFILREAPKYGIGFLTPDMVVAKLLWRRRKIESIEEDPEATFKQEYPLTLAESFQGTGRPIFRAAAVAMHRTRLGSDGLPLVRPATKRFDVYHKDTLLEGVRPKQVWALRENDAGCLHVWKGYEKREKYIVAGDPASGDGDDPSAIQVCLVRPNLFEQVAVWHGWIGMVELAHITAWLAQAYGNAFIVPEVTSIGHEYVDTLATLRWPGRRIYQRRVLSAKGETMKDKLGFDMNEVTRPGVIEQLKVLMPTENLVLRHEATLMEIEQFRRDKKGRPDHPAGGHSDLLMALGAGAYARFESGGVSHKPKRSRGTTYETANKGASGRGIILGRDGRISTSI